MEGKNRVVFGIYPTYESLESGIESLKKTGFRNSDISVLMPENVGNKDLVDIKSTKAPEGAVTGAASGAAIGGAVGWLVGIGTLAIPGLGPLIAAGPIMAALAGAGAVGALGGITGALVGMEIPEYEAKRYEGRVKKGGILISIHCEDSELWTIRAKNILKRTGAEDISETHEAKGSESDEPFAHSEA